MAGSGIRTGLLATALGVLGSAAVQAPAQAQGAQTAGLACLQAAAEAEREAGIPPGLLAAIGQVESGRRDAAAGRMLPWPWTINAQGSGRWFETAEEAARAVVALQARGVRSIDMGCFQVNAQHHAAAFATLGEAFDPRSNARYAARFLSDLRGRTGNWEAAVAAYHSSTPGLGEGYRDRVLAVWQGGTVPVVTASARASVATPRGPFPGEATGWASGWAAGRVAASMGGGARVVAGAQLAIPTGDPRVVLIAGPGIQIAGPARILGTQAAGTQVSGAAQAADLARMPRLALRVQ